MYVACKLNYRLAEQKAFFLARITPSLEPYTMPGWQRERLLMVDDESLDCYLSFIKTKKGEISKLWIIDVIYESKKSIELLRNWEGPWMDSSHTPTTDCNCGHLGIQYELDISSHVPPSQEMLSRWIGHEKLFGTRKWAAISVNSTVVASRFDHKIIICSYQ